MNHIVIKHHEHNNPTRKYLFNILSERHELIPVEKGVYFKITSTESVTKYREIFKEYKTTIFCARNKKQALGSIADMLR